MSDGLSECDTATRHPVRSVERTDVGGVHSCLGKNNRHVARWGAAGQRRGWNWALCWDGPPTGGREGWWFSDGERREWGGGATKKADRGRGERARYAAAAAGNQRRDGAGGLQVQAGAATATTVMMVVLLVVARSSGRTMMGDSGWAAREDY